MNTHTHKHTHTDTHAYNIHNISLPLFLSSPLSLSLCKTVWAALPGDETRSLLRKSVSLLQLDTTTISVKKMSSFLLQQGRKLGAEQLVTLGLEGKLDSFTVVKDWNDLM